MTLRHSPPELKNRVHLLLILVYLWNNLAKRAKLLCKKNAEIVCSAFVRVIVTEVSVSLKSWPMGKKAKFVSLELLESSSHSFIAIGTTAQPYDRASERIRFGKE